MSATITVPSGPDEEVAGLVSALRSGGAAGLSAVYRAYAAKLFDYAMGILNDREAAENAVHDALIVALHRVGQLRRPAHFAAWLYSLTRNECLRQSRRRRRSEATRQGDSRDETVQFGSDLLMRQARAWVRDAAAGLPGIEREALDLGRRHGLDDADVARVLGISPKRAAALLARTTAALERTLDVLFTTRAGHGTCTELDELLAYWDGRFTLAVRDRVSRHMESCRFCAPVTWDYAGAVELFTQLAPEPLPALLERRVLATAAVPSRVASRSDVAEPFLRTGFPVPLDRTRCWRPILIGLAALLAFSLAGLAAYLLRPESGGLLGSADWEPLGLPAVRTAQEPLPTGAAGGGPAHAGSTRTTATPEQTAPPPRTPTPGQPSRPGQPSGQGTPSAGLASPGVPGIAGATGGPGLPAGPGISALPSSTVGASPFRGPTVVDARFTDTTVDCSSQWRGIATARVRGDGVRSALVSWGTSIAAPHVVRMRGVGAQTYRAQVARLPVNTTVYWRVVVVTLGGERVTTALSTIRHQADC